MNDLQGLRVVVAGAGAVGSVAALTLLRCGADVLLADSAARGDNASGVAAGMLAPAFEALLDPVSADHFPWLAAARDGWVDLVDSLGPAAPPIDRSGAVFFPPLGDEALAVYADRLAAFDPAFQILSPGEAHALSRGLSAPGPGLFSACDWRLEPLAMLEALLGAFLAEGGRLAGEAVTGWSDNTVTLASGQARRADSLILATGAARAPWARAGELDGLTPIKGHILRFAGQGPGAGPVIRAQDVYIAPAMDGAMVGATMQSGSRDRVIEPEAVERLQSSAAAFFPALRRREPTARAGVRASTPDGLPMVGPTGDGRLILAVGARRNGWLLAPAMADVIVARIRGVSAGAFGEAFDPRRFASR